MAKFKFKKKEKTKLVLTLSKKEADILLGIISDLGDKNRSVSMTYPVEGNDVVLNDRGQKIMTKLAKDLKEPISTVGRSDYDYFDYWEAHPFEYWEVHQ